MEKSKNYRSRQYPIDFVVPLQLEECAYRLSTLPKDQREGLHIQLRRVEKSETRTLSLEQSISRSMKMSAVLDLRRWEGTSTKITGVLTLEPFRFAPRSHIKDEFAYVRELQNTENNSFKDLLFFCFLILVVVYLLGKPELLPLFCLSPLIFLSPDVYAEWRQWYYQRRLTNLIQKMLAAVPPLFYE